MSDIKITRLEHNTERKILIGLIVSDEFTREIAEQIELYYFKNKAVQELVKWCIEYWNKYGETPKKAIEELYERKSHRLEEETVSYLAELLVSLSEEYDYEHQDSFNAKFYVDQALRYFKKRKLEETLEKLEVALENDQVELAERVIKEYTPADIPTEDYIDPFASEEVVEEAFKGTGTPLFELPGILGEILNHQLYRASFVAFQGPEKSGKTWILLELCVRALKARRKVAFFEAGDLTKAQRLCRLYARLAGKPWIPTMQSGEVTLSYPVLQDEEVIGTITTEQGVFDVLTKWDGMKVAQIYGKKWKNRLRISVHTSGTLTVNKIDNLLTLWEQRDGWMPDVVIIDYADIMTCENKMLNKREQVDDIWRGLRRLSQKWNICLITATQSDAASYDAGSQTMKNFSEDKRKYGHVTATYAINRTMKERGVYVMRIAPLVIREGAVTVSNKQVAIFSHPGFVDILWKMYYVTEPVVS